VSQLLQYAYWPGGQEAERLVVVSENPLNTRCSPLRRSASEEIQSPDLLSTPQPEVEDNSGRYNELRIASATSSTSTFSGSEMKALEDSASAKSEEANAEVRSAHRFSTPHSLTASLAVRRLPDRSTHQFHSRAGGTARKDHFQRATRDI